jgi:phosphoadenosine phosphosulfate reductase
MNYATLRKTSLIYARIPRLKHKIESAQSLIQECLIQSDRPNVSFSTGKDSMVVLDLVLAIRPDASVMWHDDLWDLPGTQETLTETEQRYTMRIHRVHERDGAREFIDEFGCRPVAPHRMPVDFECDHISETLRHYKIDAEFLGLRAEESSKRTFAVARGALRWNQTLSVWHCDPIYDWTWQDVWAYTFSRDLIVHPAYQVLIDGGVDVPYARVGPLTAVRVYQYGTMVHVKQLYPELWNSFCAANPVVQSFA